MNAAEAASRTILLVEDDNNVRETTVDLLSFIGANVQAVASGHEASRFLERHAVDLVLTDMSMADGDGEWLISYLRGSPRHRHTKIVILSAHALGENVRHGIKTGADGYIVKPFAPDQFLDTVEKYLSSAPSPGGTGG